MRKIFNILFSKTEKLTDAVFLTRMTVSIMCILVLIFSISFSAYAYFSDTVSSGRSIQRSSNYSLKINPSIYAASIYASSGESYLLDNSLGSAEMEYVFNISTADDCTASVGYCKIDVITDKNDSSVESDKQTFYSDSIWNSSFSADTTKIVNRDIVIKVPAGKSAKVNLIGEWGTCSSPMSGNIIEPEFALNINIADEQGNNS